MSTAKDEDRRVAEELPDDASLAEIRYHDYVREKIALGREAVCEGRVVDQAEAERRMAAYLPGV